MTTHQIFVKSLQCGDCLNKIKDCLLKIKGVTTIDFFKDENKISITGIAIERAAIIVNLANLGYHQKGDEGHFSKSNTFDHWFCYTPQRSN